MIIFNIPLPKGIRLELRLQETALAVLQHRIGEDRQARFFMTLLVWLPAMFFLGLMLMGLCFGFMQACEKI